MKEEQDKIKSWAQRIRLGTSMSKDALDALKERFNFNAPVFIFDQNCASGVMPHQDAKMITLNAAVRDGQREVLQYLEQVLNHE